jgi:acylphosphatase
MKLQIQGYIHNLNDGRVEAIARLYEDDVDAVENVLYKGSPSSEVEDIVVEMLEDDDIIYDGFEIRYQ